MRWQERESKRQRQHEKDMLEIQLEYQTVLADFELQRQLAQLDALRKTASMNCQMATDMAAISASMNCQMVSITCQATTANVAAMINSQNRSPLEPFHAQEFLLPPAFHQQQQMQQQTPSPQFHQQLQMPSIEQQQRETEEQRICDIFISPQARKTIRLARSMKGGLTAENLNAADSFYTNCTAYMRLQADRERAAQQLQNIPDDMENREERASQQQQVQNNKREGQEDSAAQQRWENLELIARVVCILVVYSYGYYCMVALATL